MGRNSFWWGKGTKSATSLGDMNQGPLCVLLNQAKDCGQEGQKGTGLVGRMVTWGRSDGS
jgi:hypothetical protein